MSNNSIARSILSNTGPSTVIVPNPLPSTPVRNNLLNVTANTPTNKGGSLLDKSSLLNLDGGGGGGGGYMSMAERFKRTQQQILALKERIGGLRQAKEDDIDWETYGKPSDMKFAFAIRRSLRGHYGKVYSADWGGDNVSVVSAGQDGRLIIWNGFTENKKEVFRLKSAWVMTCAYEKDENQLVACGGLDNTVSIYHVTKGGSHYSHTGHFGNYHIPLYSLVGHEGYISDIKFWNTNISSGTPSSSSSSLVNNNLQLLSSSGDSTIILWDVTTGTKKQIFNDHTSDVMSVSCHPYDPNLFVSGSCDTYVRVWDIRTGHSVRNFGGHLSDVNVVNFFPSGTAVASGSDDASIRMFDLRSSGSVNILSEDRIMCGVTDLTFSKTGRLLFSSYEESYIIAWETIAKEGTFHELKGHRNRVSTLGVNISGNALLSGSWDTELAIWC